MHVWRFAMAVALGLPAFAGGSGAGFIDDHIFEKMRRDGVKPAPLSSDSEFLRRVHLDLTGRVPTAEAARQFLDDSDPGKRDKLIDSLFPSVPSTGVGRRPPSRPFLDR